MGFLSGRDAGFMRLYFLLYESQKKKSEYVLQTRYACLLRRRHRIQESECILREDLNPSPRSTTKFQCGRGVCRLYSSANGTQSPELTFELFLG